MATGGEANGIDNDAIELHELTDGQNESATDSDDNSYTSANPNDMFILSSDSDAGYAIKMCKILKKHYTIKCVTKEDIRLGKTIISGIEEFIQESKITVAILSPSAQSPFDDYQRELSIFSSGSKFIPVLYKTCKLRLYLSTFHCLDARPIGVQEVCYRLKEALRNDCTVGEVLAQDPPPIVVNGTKYTIYAKETAFGFSFKELSNDQVSNIGDMQISRPNEVFDELRRKANVRRHLYIRWAKSAKLLHYMFVAVIFAGGPPLVYYLLFDHYQQESKSLFSRPIGVSGNLIEERFRVESDYTRNILIALVVFSLAPYTFRVTQSYLQKRATKKVKDKAQKLNISNSTKPGGCKALVNFEFLPKENPAIHLVYYDLSMCKERLTRRTLLRRTICWRPCGHKQVVDPVKEYIQDYVDVLTDRYATNVHKVRKDDIRHLTDGRKRCFCQFVEWKADKDKLAFEDNIDEIPPIDTDC